MCPTPVPIYTAPKYVMPTRRMAEIVFQSLVAANSQLTIVSGLIDFAFVVRMVTCDFASDHNDRVFYYWLLSTNQGASTTTVPPDTSIFGYLGGQQYITGDNREKKAYPNVVWKEAKSYIKLHVINGNSYPIRAKGTVLIEETVT